MVCARKNTSKMLMDMATLAITIGLRGGLLAVPASPHAAEDQWQGTSSRACVEKNFAPIRIRQHIRHRASLARFRTVRKRLAHKLSRIVYHLVSTRQTFDASTREGEREQQSSYQEIRLQKGRGPTRSSTPRETGNMEVFRVRVAWERRAKARALLVLSAPCRPSQSRAGC